MLTLQDRIITLSTCNALQYSLLQCNVVIRESFLFRYSAIPLFLIPHFTGSHWAVLVISFGAIDLSSSLLLGMTGSCPDAVGTCT